MPRPRTSSTKRPYEHTAVAYDKGCYLGQEVVARLKTYGTPKAALVGLLGDADATAPPAPGTTLHVDGAKVGEMCSTAYSPTLERWIGLAYLDRNHRTPGTHLNLTGTDPNDIFNAEVRALPLVQARTRDENARALYDEALVLFEQDIKDEDDTAINALKHAILLNPRFEDAYEALGVILHRHHRVDEAIHYMKLLAKLNPACVMAHTNLSVFYVSKGMITEAENEKALANQLEFKRQIDARDAEKVAEAERARIRGEAEEKIAMFKEVLEIDPEDPIATMGIGASYMQLDRYEDAIPHLETAVRVKKDYSAAYLNLGKCHEFLGQTAQASEAYRAGIEAASRKGDLMPLREMERRLRAL
jgi:tetratricopeptide (TPR) repeat protein